MSDRRVTAPSALVLMTTRPNSSGVFSRPWTWIGSWKAEALVAKGGWPIEPAAAWTFWARSAATISVADRLRAAALAGSIQTRME